MRDLVGDAGLRMGFVSSTGDPDGVFYEQKRVYYAEELGAELHVFVDAESGDADWRALAACGAVHLSGGNTFAFQDWLRASGRLAELRRLAQAGSVLIGESAGSILCTPSVEIATLCGRASEVR